MLHPPSAQIEDCNCDGRNCGHVGRRGAAPIAGADRRLQPALPKELSVFASDSRCTHRRRRSKTATERMQHFVSEVVFGMHKSTRHVPIIPSVFSQAGGDGRRKELAKTSGVLDPHPTPRRRLESPPRACAVARKGVGAPLRFSDPRARCYPMLQGRNMRAGALTGLGRTLLGGPPPRRNELFGDAQAPLTLGTNERRLSSFC